MYRVFFLGQGELGERCFKLLRNIGGYEISLACSNATTDVWWKTNGIYIGCNEQNIPFLSNKTRAEAEILKLINHYGVNMLVSVRHPWILSPAILQSVNYIAFNLHCAKLPDYKGFNACNHAILNGDKDFTVTIHMMDDKVDTGDIVLENCFEIEASDTASTLYAKANEAGAILFRKLFDLLIAGQLKERKKVTAKGHFYARDSLEPLREIKNNRNWDEVDKKSRAFFFPPFEPAYFILHGKKFYVVPSTLPDGAYASFRK